MRQKAITPSYDWSIQIFVQRIDRGLQQRLYFTLQNLVVTYRFHS